MQVYGDDVTFPSAVVSLLYAMFYLYGIPKKIWNLCYWMVHIACARVAKVYTASEVAVSVPDLP